MSKILETLRAEISRLAKKEIKASVEPLRQNVAGLKRSVSKVSKSLAALEKQLKAQKAAARRTPAGLDVKEVETDKTRLSPILIKKLRKRLKISQAKLAQLLNVSAPAVASWEQGRAKPSPPTRTAIIALRSLSPAKAREMLAEIKLSRKAVRKTKPGRKRKRVARK